MTRKSNVKFAAVAILFACSALWLLAGCGSDDNDDPVAPASNGDVVVEFTPAGIDASWQLSGPNSYSADGTADETLNGLPTGDYTISWGTVDGYVTPPDETLGLAEDATVTFLGAYVAEVGTITVVPGPGYLYLTWTLTGPGGFSASSFEEQTYSNMPLGDYTITWDEQTDWNTPDPETQTLTAGGTIEFTATYTPGPNTVMITKEPADLSITWGLAGPNSLSAGGAGTGEFIALLGTDVTPGEYTMTWHDVAGWTTPAPETLTLEDGGTLHFHGVYVEQ